MLRKSLIFSIVLVSLSTMYDEPARSEGFPGKGDRLLYAEALPHYNLGNRYLAKEWYEKAIEKYNDAINIYPYDADVYTNLTVAYRKVGDVAQAEAASRKAVELNDKDWTSWSNLANLLMVEDKFPEAYACFQKALKCNIPQEERTHIESNIDGMKKIMKARGLTVDGRSLESPPVAGAKSKKAAATASGAAPVKKTTAKPIASKELAGSKESELDGKAYDQWLSQ